MKYFFTTFILAISLKNIAIKSQEHGDNNNIDQVKFNLDNHSLRNQQQHNTDSSTFHYKEPKKVRCYECHSIGNTSWLSSCTRKRFCTGLWCVKGPDEGGFFRGCMDTLPFLDHTEKCITYKDTNGIIKENCYCNSEFCNSSTSLTLPLSLIIVSFLLILRFTF
uniref:Activin_recp domain-containing protein n=1 Tax=Strongyloides venezuelensis TaxID=75913 RepID=A0A0K0FDK5_STRVS